MGRWKPTLRPFLRSTRPFDGKRRRPGVDDPAGTPHRPASRAGTPGRQDAREIRAIHQTVPVEIAEKVGAS